MAYRKPNNGSGSRRPIGAAPALPTSPTRQHRVAAPYQLIPSGRQVDTSTETSMSQSPIQPVVEQQAVPQQATNMADRVATPVSWGQHSAAPIPGFGAESVDDPYGLSSQTQSAARVDYGGGPVVWPGMQPGLNRQLEAQNTPIPSTRASRVPPLALMDTNMSPAPQTSQALQVSPMGLSLIHI